MTKNQKPEHQPSYFYTLPGDAKRAQAEGLAWGSLAALRDYPQGVVRDRQQVEAIARASCLQFTSLTNDFDALCEAVIPQYADCYEHQISRYAQDAAVYRKDLLALQEVGGDWARALQIQIAHFSQLIDQMEQESR